MQSEFPHLIDLDDYTPQQWREILSLGHAIKEAPLIYAGACRGKIMGTLFYEPSTRTQMSFQTAMLRLGGGIIGFDNPNTSSVSKGENLKDTTKIVSSYSDIVVMRHYLEGAAKSAALTADCPIINAGDGGHLHPTQTLTDLLTLQEEKETLENLTVGFCGDLKNGRTVHSLLKALSCFDGNRFILVSTPELALPTYIKDFISASGKEYVEYATLEEAMPKLDVLYMTRIQRERFTSPEEYEKQKNVYCLDTEKMKLGKSELIVLHPMPRVDEIEISVDDDPRAMYFRQASYGMYVRMALILYMLDYKPTSKPLLKGEVVKDVCCKNPKCICQSEHYLPHSFQKQGDMLICDYCDDRLLI